MFQVLLDKVLELRCQKKTALQSIDLEIQEVQKRIDLATFDLQKELQSLTEQRAVMGQPYEADEKELIKSYEAAILSHAQTWKGQGGKISFRKGATTITFDHKVVDSVLATLKDVMPNLAERLQKARNETHGQPSYKVELDEG